MTILPLLWFAIAALRGRFEANWPAFLDPALCAAAAAALSAFPPKLRQALSVAASAAAVAAVIVLGLELRHPRFVPPTNVEVARFHDGTALAEAVRAHLNGTHPFFFTNDYQDAGELAFYSRSSGSYARFGPCLERPSQLDVWGNFPARGEPFVFLGNGGDRDALRAHFPGARELRTEFVQPLSRRSESANRLAHLVPGLPGLRSVGSSCSSLACGEAGRGVRIAFGSKGDRDALALPGSCIPRIDAPRLTRGTRGIAVAFAFAVVGTRVPRRVAVVADDSTNLPRESRTRLHRNPSRHGSCWQRRSCRHTEPSPHMRALWSKLTA